MVRQMLKGITMLMLLLALSLVTASVSAQGSHSEYANIPFDFVTGDTEMTAGRYQVSRMTSNGDAICVRGTENSQSAIKLSNNLVRTNPATESKLVFHRYGNTYFLAEVWIQGETNGRQIRKSNAEKAVERELAASQKRFESVTVALARD